MSDKKVTIRQEQPGDVQEIRHVNLCAFEQAAEANVVDRLRDTCPDRVSLVALHDDHVVGHLLFTPAVLETKGGAITGMGLAPVSVLPEEQRQGIGSQLIKAGLEEIQKAKHPFVIVLGHPEYYPRFGFVPASRYGITSEYEGVPDEAFMILIFDEKALQGASGIAKYRPEFGAAM